MLNTDWLNYLSKNTLLRPVIIFLILIGFIISYCKLSRSLIEPMECNVKQCPKTFNQTVLDTIHQTSNGIDLLREQLNNYNIKPIRKRLLKIQQSINNNTEELKAIASQAMDDTNASINLDVRGDGNVYDLDGNPLYSEV